MDEIMTECKPNLSLAGVLVAFLAPAGSSSLMLICARLRYVAGTQWRSKRNLNMKRLEFMDMQIPETEVI